MAVTSMKLLLTMITCWGMKILFIKYHIDELSANMSLLSNRANPCKFHKF
jgi:hypothetical protein